MTAAGGWSSVAAAAELPRPALSVAPRPPSAASHPFSGSHFGGTGGRGSSSRTPPGFPVAGLAGWHNRRGGRRLVACGEGPRLWNHLRGATAASHRQHRSLLGPAFPCVPRCDPQLHGTLVSPSIIITTLFQLITAEENLNVPGSVVQSPLRVWVFSCGGQNSLEGATLPASPCWRTRLVL